jgi:ribonuclease BN (tRNA processing enzyme)
MALVSPGRYAGAGHTVHSCRVEVRFIGSGDAFGSGGRFQTCIRLQARGYTALVDCGATSLTAMKSQDLRPGEVEAVVISHLHGDHFGGLPFLILDGQFSGRTRPLTVFGPVGTRDRLHTAMETMYPGSAAVQRRFELEVRELDGTGGTQTAGPLEVSSWEVDHASGAPALAVHAVLDGGRFAYSGDTAWTPALLDAAAGSDIFACEAYTYDKAVRFHLDYATLRAHADRVRTNRIVVTHMGPSMLSRLADLDLDHTPASDGLTLQT